MHAVVILTIDFGTTVTKVGLWGDDGLVALAGSESDHDPSAAGLGRAGPAALVDVGGLACAEARAQAPAAPSAVDVVACFGRPPDLRPGDADRRSDREGHLVVRPPGGARGAAVWPTGMGGDDINRARPGSRSTPRRWRPSWPGWREPRPDRLDAGRLILSPRDLVVFRMTDQVVTDATFASRSGLYDFDGNAVGSWPAPALGKLPSVVPSGP